MELFIYSHPGSINMPRRWRCGVFPGCNQNQDAISILRHGGAELSARTVGGIQSQLPCIRNRAFLASLPVFRPSDLNFPV
jgi:hypothetical protein